MPSFYKPLLLATVFTTGAAVLIFEVSAVRALSPFFGSSIYVVSSVLTVILSALSLGYYLGGRLADKRPDVRLLYLIIATSGLIMNLLFLFSLLVFPLANHFLPITYGPLILSLIFFFIPAFLLGIDSPFVIKLLTTTEDINHHGAVVGSTFFWSTLGSITGSLASGFLLIPFLGVTLSFVGTATIVSIASCLAYLLLLPHTKQDKPIISSGLIITITICSVILASIIMISKPLSLNSGEILYRQDGYYSQIEIREKISDSGKTIRSLHREVNHSSAIEVGSTNFIFAYTEYARLYPFLQTSTENFLVIGGGAYTVPRTLLQEDPDLLIDVVEIEPGLYDLAKTYFELPDSPRLTNYPMDARSFLRTTNQQYDVIFADAFQSGHFIPPHLATAEFFADVHRHLTEEGIFIVNIIGMIDQTDRNLTASLIKTIQTSFPNPTIYQASATCDQLCNIIVVGKKNGTSAILSENFIVDIKNGEVASASSRILPLDKFYLDQQLVFTDDRAPVELLVAKQILAY
jgi:predicted membrane-bound spermidine synthase